MKYQETTARFDKGSESYRTDSIKYRKISADKVTQMASPSSFDIILDLGCGTGTQLIELSGKIQNGIGIDISSGMIRKAEARMREAGCTNLEFHVGDFLVPDREVRLTGRGVNKIISNYALHHLTFEDKKRAVEKMIELAGENLQMIVIGDLMFFDDPENHTGQYGQIGYGPGSDLPCGADELSGLFDKKIFTVDLEAVHPLVGVLKAEVRR